jgi:hypothetical protein
MTTEENYGKNQQREAEKAVIKDEAGHGFDCQKLG